jgi:hypothetical protein
MSLEGIETIFWQDGNDIQNVGPSLTHLLASQQLLSQGDLLVVGAALAYTFHCIRLENYAKQTRAVTLTACKAITETMLSVLLVVVLLAYNSNSHGDTSAEGSSNFLVSFASESIRIGNI